MKKLVALVMALLVLFGIILTAYAARSDNQEHLKDAYAEEDAWRWVPETVTEYVQEYGTIVVVDLVEQHVYCAVDGEIIADSDCISGDAYESPTPTGLYSVWGTNSDFYMRGTYYSAYAVFFNGGIAIHDADSWRDEYGDDIYRGNGSLGCVNVPCWFAEIVHKNAGIGTLVYVF